MAPLAELEEASQPGHSFIMIHYLKFRRDSDYNSQWQNPENFTFLLTAELHSPLGEALGEARLASHVNENLEPVRRITMRHCW